MPCSWFEFDDSVLSGEFNLNRICVARKSILLFILFLAIRVYAQDPLKRCHFVFSSRRHSVLENLKNVNGIIRWNWYVTNRTLNDYEHILSDSKDESLSLKHLVLQPRQRLRWWDSGGGQGVAIRDGANLLAANGQEAFLMVNSLSRPLSTKFFWPKNILYLAGVRSEEISKQYVEAFDLITDVFGPGGSYAVDVVGVLNSYLQALAVGGRLAMSTSFRTKVAVGNRVISLSKWIENKINLSSDFRVNVIEGQAIWIEKLRTSDFRLPELDIDTYVSAEELYRGYIEPEFKKN